MRTFFTGGLVVCTMVLIIGCQTESGGPIEEGGCFPTGPDMDDYTEADAFCRDTYCPMRDCENQVVAEAMCLRPGLSPGHVCDCECCDPQPSVGGTPSNPEVWEEVYTCILDSPPCEQDTPVKLELVQTGACGQTVDWTIAEGPGQGSQYSGTLSGTSFRWEQTAPEGVEEEGCWAFSADAQRFNKLSGGLGFDCVGTGSRGAGSDPGDLPTCEEIEAAGIGDFTSCPPSPPASPIE